MRCSFIIARDLRSAGTIKKERGNPNDSARFIGKVAVTEDGETAKIYNYLDTEKIEQEALYDGMYAVRITAIKRFRFNLIRRLRFSGSHQRTSHNASMMRT